MTTRENEREDLATFLNGRIGNVRWHHDTPEAMAGEREYWLSVADSLLSRWSLSPVVVVAESPKLDPEPWDCGRVHYCDGRASAANKHFDRFAPRPEYSQSEEDYR